MDQSTEVETESGVATSQGAPSQATPCRNERESTFIAKFCDKYVVGFIKDEGSQLINNEANSIVATSANVETWKVRLLDGKESGNHAERTAVMEKCKKPGNKKPHKPPRPPKGPTLDAADQLLIREITELAMLKRARVERVKAWKKTRASKPSSSSSSIIVMVFTTMFFLVILFQGVLSGKSSASSFQGSPVPLGGNNGGLISVQYLNPSAIDPNAPHSEFHNLVKQVTGSDPPDKLGRSMDKNMLTMGMQYGD